jgi:L-rhamnose isomerase/sugar isomerase
MIQTVCTAQELYAKAAIVNHARLSQSQQTCSLVEVEETQRGAFWCDVRPILSDGHAMRCLEPPRRKERDRQF